MKTTHEMQVNEIVFHQASEGGVGLRMRDGSVTVRAVVSAEKAESIHRNLSRVLGQSGIDPVSDEVSIADVVDLQKYVAKIETWEDFVETRQEIEDTLFAYTRLIHAVNQQRSNA